MKVCKRAGSEIPRLTSNFSSYRYKHRDLRQTFNIISSTISRFLSTILHFSRLFQKEQWRSALWDKKISSGKDGPFYTVREERCVTLHSYLEQGIWWSKTTRKTKAQARLSVKSVISYQEIFSFTSHCVIYSCHSIRVHQKKQGKCVLSEFNQCCRKRKSQLYPLGNP